jgi:hypothetical protein
VARTHTRIEVVEVEADERSEREPVPAAV